MILIVAIFSPSYLQIGVRFKIRSIEQPTDKYRQNLWFNFLDVLFVKQIVFQLNLSSLLLSSVLNFQVVRFHDIKFSILIHPWKLMLRELK